MNASSSKAISGLDKTPNTQFDHIPGKKGLPFIGSSIEFIRDYPGLIEGMYQQYGKVFTLNLIFGKEIILLGPEANEFVLKDEAKIFSSKMAWDLFLEELFPRGLLLRDGANHRHHRKIMQVAFKKPAIESYIERMGPAIKEGIDQWPINKKFQFFKAIKQMTLDLACDIFLDMPMGSSAEVKKINKAFINTLAATIAISRRQIPGTTWYRGIKGRKYLEGVVSAMVPSKRNGQGSDFFTQICNATSEEGDQFSDQEVTDHIIFLMLAAHDTTTSVLSTVMYELAKNPYWQETLYEEFKSINKAQLNYDDLDKLEKTSWVFKEALRANPPIVLISRRATRECEFGGYTIPENSTVTVVPMHTHHMKEYWSDPERFDPMRFSPERAEDKKHFFQWVPFGGGAHKCIGLYFAEVQAKLFLYHFLMQYRVYVPHNYTTTFQHVPISKPKDGLPIKIKRIRT